MLTGRTRVDTDTRPVTLLEGKREVLVGDDDCSDEASVLSWIFGDKDPRHASEYYENYEGGKKHHSFRTPLGSGEFLGFVQGLSLHVLLLWNVISQSALYHRIVLLATLEPESVGEGSIVHFEPL